VSRIKKVDLVIPVYNEEVNLPRLGNPRLAYHNASFLNPDVIERLMRGVELVYHLGAVVGVEHYVTDPFRVLNVNVNGTQHVLAAAPSGESFAPFRSAGFGEVLLSLTPGTKPKP
jgi:nucleoside-diphosphate-sugar epimerase